MPEHDLEVEVTSMVVITLRGEIDFSGLDALQSVIEPQLAQGQTIVMDLSEVTFADSTLLNLLKRAHGKASEIGAALLVRNPAPNILRLLSIGDLDDLVQIEVNRQNDLR